jgi:hypothetical protein
VSRSLLPKVSVVGRVVSGTSARVIRTVSKVNAGATDDVNRQLIKLLITSNW